ncbi:MAG: MarR family transcriptional regulator [Oscillospiraceae bacterium]
MYDFEKMDRRCIVFANIFLVANRLQTVMDRQSAGITSKQWLVITMLGMFDSPPTLGELAKICNSTHQNIKQIAKKLELKGFLRIETDQSDRRALRIVALDKCRIWGIENDKFCTDFLEEMFSTLSQEEISILCKSQDKIYNKLDEMGKAL